jgi:hypothetical protein
MRLVIRPSSFSKLRALKPSQRRSRKRRCAIAPFANGGGYTEAIAKSVAV